MINHFFIESGLEMIQFKIQFKAKSKIFIKKISTQYIVHSKELEENHSLKKCQDRDLEPS